MANFSFNVLGYIYEDGISSLRTMFERATAGLDEYVLAAYSAVDKYDQAVAAGGGRRR